MREQLTAHRSIPEPEESGDRLTALDQVFARIDRAITSRQVATALVEGGRDAAGAQSGALVLLTPERQDLRVMYATGDGMGRATHHQTLPMTARFPLADVVRTRRELWLTNPDELVEQYPDAEPTDGSRAWAVLPVHIDGVMLGAVGWSFRRQWLSGYQRACLRSLVEAGGVALYRAGVFDSERAARMRSELGSYSIVHQDQMIAQLVRTLDTSEQPPNVPATLREAARFALPRLGECCSIQVMDEHNRLRHATTIHLDATKERLLQRVAHAIASSAKKLPSALNSGEPLVIEDLPTNVRRVRGKSQRQVEALRMVGLKRVVIVPMRIHGLTLGTVCFGTSKADRAYDDADLLVADRIARRCAAWLEYVRMREIAERANQAREEFVAATSHELRTPLSHIKGFVSTLRTNDTAWDTSTRDDFLAEIEQEADRLASLVETLLDLSRIDAAGLDPTQRRPCSPEALIAAGIDRVRASLVHRQIDVQVTPDLAWVSADASHIERVLANLLDNAAKYSPPEQPISIVARNSGRSVVFRVEDRGLGIPAAHVERIFEPFFREPTGAYPAKPGTGLGLAICRSIIHSHRGRIWAEARPGGGAVIAFSVPIATESQRT
jgi:signal transduction histidine kinase